MDSYVVQEHGRIIYQVLHQTLEHEVARIVVVSRKILLQEAGHSAVYARPREIIRVRIGIDKLRAEDCKVWIAEVSEQQLTILIWDELCFETAELINHQQLLPFKGDERDTIHLRPCTQLR